MGRPVNLSKMGNRANLSAHQQVVVQAYVGGSVQDAFLKQQKNKNTFVVVDVATGLSTAICKLVASAVNPGEMSIIATPNVGPTVSVSRITNRFVWDFSNTKYFWGFDARADATILDTPSFLYVTLPTTLVPTPATPNPAP
jgi:hypothetical protein